LTTMNPIREPDYVFLRQEPPTAGVRTKSARGQNFMVEWISFSVGGEHSVSLRNEAILILPDVAATVSGDVGDARAPSRSVVILPSGHSQIRLKEAGLAIILKSEFSAAEAGACVNAATYETLNPLVAPVRSLSPRGKAGLRVYPIDDVMPASGRSRLKMLQSSTMSINWVEYDGPRDRRQLSPHSHEDFEQGSLAIHGQFVNHFRVPWGPDAEVWRDDAHLPVEPSSLTVIPPGLIHTTEGIGPGRHLLLDIFAPARFDFREKGWIANAAEYADP
jgi:mannose-6-phosphate isomerase-like protein (cupin superfamily)